MFSFRLYVCVFVVVFLFFFKQKTAYERRISDWSSDVCSSDLGVRHRLDFLGNPIFEEIETVSNTTPTACGECRWRDMCRGGDLENRFSAVKDRKSVV